MTRLWPPIILIALALLLSGGSARPADAFAAGTPAIGGCHEDAPCWTWSTMGNRSRGVVLHVAIGANRAVVGPCGFARLAHRGLIDWTRTPRLRGDWTARRIGCRR